MKARYLFFGGKGGVGKTTAASATALYLLNKSKKDESILLFSTDPAHSLSDSLDVKIGNRLVEVKQLRGARLFAYEMDASLALERFREQHGKVLTEIAEREIDGVAKRHDRTAARWSTIRPSSMVKIRSA